jgi:hypothetical protein
MAIVAIEICAVMIAVCLFFLGWWSHALWSLRNETNLDCTCEEHPAWPVTHIERAVLLRAEKSRQEREG